jgi:gas vesicle protein
MNAQANPSTNFMQTMLQGTAKMIDVQMSIARAFWETQAKTAALLGAPDISRNLSHHEGAGRSLEQTMGHAVDYGQRVLGAYCDLQTQWIRFVQQQAEFLTERVQEDIRETSHRVEEGMNEAADLAKRAIPSTEEKQRQFGARGNAGAQGEQKDIQHKDTQLKEPPRQQPSRIQS